MSKEIYCPKHDIFHPMNEDCPGCSVRLVKPAKPAAIPLGPVTYMPAVIQSLSRRDHFAMAAMQAAIRNDPVGERQATGIATEACNVADALIEELDRVKP